MTKKMNNKRGMALVVALLTSFILLALVASLFWVIASTSRQSEYAKNSAIALNLAEAGTADAIYRLNYCGTDGIGLYPFADSLNPFGTPVSTLITLPADILTTAVYGPTLQNSVIFGTLNNGNYYVGLIDNATYADTIISVGIYKGIRRILTVPLRGNNDPTKTRHLSPSPVTQGISEAFNKHVIYANQVIATGGTVNGNIVYTNSATFAQPAGGNWTNTIITASQFGIPVPDFTFPSESGVTYTDTYLGGHYYISGVDQSALPMPPTTPVNYAAGTGTYTFDGATVDTPTWVTDGPVEIKGTTQITQIRNAFRSAGAITVSGPLAFSGSNSFLHAVPGVITLNLNNIATACSLYVVDSDLNFINNSQISPDSTSIAAIIISSSGSHTVTTVTMDNTDNRINTGSGKAAIIAQLPAGGRLTIDSNSSAPTYHIAGLIYAYALTPAANIILTNGTINGALVADGTVTLNGGILNYETPAFTGASSGFDIFSGFSGGRRAYVPAWQGWKLK